MKEPSSTNFTDLARSGLSSRDAARIALANGLDPVDVIKRLKASFGLTIGEGKTLVDSTTMRYGSNDRHADEFLRLQSALAMKFPMSATAADIEAFEKEAGWRLKAWALVKADMAKAAWNALERFDDNSLTIATLSHGESRAAVVKEIATWPERMVVMDDATQEHDFGWVFSAQNEIYAESRDMSKMTIGHGPFIVDRFTAVMWTTGSAQDGLANYRATRDPRVAGT